MSNDPQAPNRRKSEKAPPSGGGNILWLVIGLAVLLALVLWTSVKSTISIPYSQLMTLIEQGAPAKNPNAAIIVTEGSGKTKVSVRYSNLKVTRVSGGSVSGEIDREVLEPVKDATPVQTKTFQSGRSGLEFSTPALVEMLQKHGFDFSGGEPESPWGLQFSWLLLLSLPVLILMFMLFRRMGGPGSAIAFGQSRGKLYAQEDIDVNFEQVAGIDEAVDELREVVEFLKTPEKFRLLGGRIPKGVLLVGPPGTGKTLLAKAIAGEAGVPFFSLSGSDFVEMFVGVGAARVRDMFHQAQTRAPCIVFIDELDALGKTRGTSIVGGHDEREQTLNALLVEMDGFGSNSGVIILAATNRPETLDPALLRPGRFDRHVLVDRPDVRGREAILKVHTKDVKIDPSVRLADVAAITPGFVGADLANLVNEAALLAARKDMKTVTMAEFTEAVERVTAGLEKRQRVMNPEEKQRVAYHESAHALVASSLPNTDPVHKVSIIPRGLAALGYVLQRPEGDRYVLTQSELESRIQVALAGTVAEEMVYQDVSTGAQNDLERATEIARSMVMDYGMSRLGKATFRESGRSAFIAGPADLPRERAHSEQTAREIDEEIRRILEGSLTKVRHILKSRYAALDAIAKRLMEKEVIDQEELLQIVESSCPNPQIVPGTEAALRRTPATPSAAQEAPSRAVAPTDEAAG